jgi:hypothetical protein
MCVAFTVAILASQGDASKEFKIVDEKCEKERALTPLVGSVLIIPSTKESK